MTMMIENGNHTMKIIFTGGGTAGHVTPNLALWEKLQRLAWECVYFGGPQSIEADLAQRAQIPFEAICSGKLRRAWSLKNLATPFKVLLGILQASICLYRLKPQLVFSKGGFVAVPVVIAARLLQIPVIAHESDFSPGLANRMSYPWVKKICVTFEKSLDFFKHSDKIVVTGTPIREQLLQGDPKRAEQLCQFVTKKPVLLLIGGSQGSRVLMSYFEKDRIVC